MNDQNGYIVDATGVHKTYSTGKVTVPALRGIDLKVKRGEMVAIMGPSGCGKTTTLNCLSGLDDIDSGMVIVEDQIIHDLPDDDRSDYRARRMGFVFQLYNLLPVLSAVENVEMPLLVSGISSKEARRRSLELLEQVGLADRADHLPGELFGRPAPEGHHREGACKPPPPSYGRTSRPATSTARRPTRSWT